MIRRTQLLSGILLSCAALASRISAQQPVAEPVLRLVQVDGHAMRVQVSGLASRVAGRPIIVFEAGATNSLEAWRSVVPQLVGTAPLVAYDRVGLGGSAWDEQTPTPQHVSARLRRLLREIGADPQQHFLADLRHRINTLPEWSLASSHGTVVMTNHASHAVPREDPDLIVWAVQRVLSAIAK